MTAESREMPNHNPLDSLEAIHDEIIEMVSSLNALTAWLNGNKTYLAWDDRDLRVFQNTDLCIEQALTLGCWVQGNIDMDRRVFPRPDVVQATLFAKKLRSQMRGTSMNFNSITNAAHLRNDINSPRQKIKMFADAGKMSIRICEAIRALETE